MIVVADTSPLNYLVLLGHIDILAKIYAEVLVLQTVLDELQDSDEPRRFVHGLRLPRAGCKSALSSSG
jgi:predicted nucleic acid-binding protein